MPTALWTRLPTVLALITVVHGYHASDAQRASAITSHSRPASSPASPASPPPTAGPPHVGWTGHQPSRTEQRCSLRECRTSAELLGQLPRRDDEEAIVLFSSRNCRACHRLRRQVAEFTRKARSRALFLHINYSPMTIDAFREFEVSSTPTLLRLDSNGQPMTVGSLRELKELLT